MKTFTDRLIDAIRAKKSLLCVGLDPQLQFIPAHIRAWALANYNASYEAIGEAFFRFNKEVIDAVAPFAACVKPQAAFYEGYGKWGWDCFEKTIDYAHSQGLLVITDAKRGDGSDTAVAYAAGHIGEVPFWGETEETISYRPGPIRADALTVHGWIGEACLNPFLKAVKECSTGVFVVAKTSFTPNSKIEQLENKGGYTVWEEMAYLVEELGEGTEGQYGYRNIGAVLGATKAEDAPTMRAILPNSWLLVPGYGKQGGGALGAVAACNGDGLGCIVNSSRGVIFAYESGTFQSNSKDFLQAAARAAEFSRDDLNLALEKAGKLKF